MRRIGNPARKQVLACRELSSVKPGKHRLSGLFGDFELNGLLVLRCMTIAVKDASSLRYILYAKTNEVAPTQLAINSEIEECKVSHLFG